MSAIPDCLKLEKRQIEKMKQFELANPFTDKEKRSLYEDAAGCSFWSFKIYGTGMGDVIKATYANKGTIDLSIDDDGDLYNG